MDAYMKWMLDKMNYRKHGKGKYGRLMRKLNEREFTYTLLLDENRVYDAVEMRNRFLDETFTSKHTVFGDDLTQYCSNLLFGPDRCSLLEMFTALSIRCEMEITGMPGKDHIDRMFWVMLDNLGLNSYPDDKWDEAEVNAILDELLVKSDKNRLFPLKRSDINDKVTDIWMMMRIYISENKEL